jgi:hypothetical protein
MFGIGVASSLLSKANSQETTVLASLGFLSTGPAVGTAAASLMTWMGGAAGIQAGSAYAVAQSVAMGGGATGVIATVGGMTVGGLTAVAAIPVAVAGGTYYYMRR